MFGFKDEPNWIESEKFLIHADLVVSGLGKMVNHGPNLETLHESHNVRGRKHMERGVTMAHYGVLAQSMLMVFEAAMGDAFTEELKQAWVEFTTKAFEVMTRGHYLTD